MPAELTTILSWSERPNKRLNVLGAAEECRIALVQQLILGDPKSVQRAPAACARSLSAMCFAPAQARLHTCLN